MRGKAVIKGTRIGVDLILENIGAGEMFEELLKAYPFLSKEVLLACIFYGAAFVRNETLVDVGNFPLIIDESTVDRIIDALIEEGINKVFSVLNKNKLRICKLS